MVTDPGATESQRSPWRCYRACLETFLLPRYKTASHLLLIQDDAEVCRDFAVAVTRVTAARPAHPLCLFVPGVGANHRRILDACYQENRWAELDPNAWVPVVATVWPRDHVRRILEFAAAKNYAPSRSADDAIIGDYCREEGVTVLAPVPSLVEHPDRVDSLVGTANFGGLSPTRIAACWIGHELSALDFEW